MKGCGMKKNLIASYVSGIMDYEHGESYRAIFRYFYPEMVTALLLYAVPFWIESYFIGQLQSTTMYATLGVTNSLLHTIIKLAESFAVGTTVLCGRFNGMLAYDDVGRSVRDAFWTTCLVGFLFAIALYFGADWIYWWYGVAPSMAARGIPFLKLRAVGVLFTFVYFAFIGFMRGVKNTKTPMVVFLVGAITQIVLQRILIFGAFGLPAMGLQGVALAAIVQQGTMLLTALGFVVFSSKNRRYVIDLFKPISQPSYIKNLIQISWPVTVDKVTFAASYVWLAKIICPMGKYASASFCAVREMERFALVPAVALAQIITFLVSNDIGAGDLSGVKSNIKKVMLMATSMVFIILMIFTIWSSKVVWIFDQKGAFTDFVTRAFPPLAILALLDLLQLILSGALRGAGDVKTVMYVRMAICLGYFVPVSYALAHLPIANEVVKFVLVYGSFYVGAGLMGIIYVRRFRGKDWNIRIAKRNHDQNFTRRSAQNSTHFQSGTPRTGDRSAHHALRGRSVLR